MRVNALDCANCFSLFELHGEVFRFVVGGHILNVNGDLGFKYAWYICILRSLKKYLDKLCKIF